MIPISASRPWIRARKRALSAAFAMIARPRSPKGRRCQALLYDDAVSGDDTYVHLGALAGHDHLVTHGDLADVAVLVGAVDDDLIPGELVRTARHRQRLGDGDEEFLRVRAWLVGVAGDEETIAVEARHRDVDGGVLHVLAEALLQLFAHRARRLDGY